MLPALAGLLAAALVSTPVCTPTDPGLVELSGLAEHDGRWYATGDGGAALRIPQLDPATCATVDVLTPTGDPRDIEDLAVGGDGRVWLADIGDNRRNRETVALFAVDGASATLFRLRYPDGPHDAEALLLERDGRPVIVTKEITGAAGVYAPLGPLAAPGPTDLVRLGTVNVTATDTPGGPVGTLGSVLVTGGAVSPDGTVAVIRTYTDAYVFAAPDGDAVTALRGSPIRVPLPDEPQGEAIAVTSAGDLVSGSEAANGPLPPIRVVPRGAQVPQQAQPAPTPPTPPPAQTDAAPPGDSGVGTGTGAVLALLAAALVVWIGGLLFRRR